MIDPSKDSTVVTTLPEAERIKGMIFSLQESLQKALPNYESLLHTIHQALAKSPDTVHLLDEQEIGVIVSGLTKKTGVVLAEKNEKKEKSTKFLKGLSLDDI